MRLLLRPASKSSASTGGRQFSWHVTNLRNHTFLSNVYHSTGIRRPRTACGIPAARVAFSRKPPRSAQRVSPPSGDRLFSCCDSDASRRDRQTARSRICFLVISKRMTLKGRLESRLEHPVKSVNVRCWRILIKRTSTDVRWSSVVESGVRIPIPPPIPRSGLK